MASKAPVLGTTKTVDLDDAAFGAEFHESLVHASVRAELAARRQGTHATKTRGKVRGGGAKPWRQKGTGRARAGSIRAPHWTGGGIVFGPSPRSYIIKVNRKERRAALRSALSVHAARDTIAVFDPTDLVDDPKTKVAAELLADWGQRIPVLVVLTDEQSRAALAFRNLERVSVLPAQDIGVDRPHRRRRCARLAGGARRADRPRHREGGSSLMDPSQVLIRPVVSEKSYVLAAVDKYTFRVHPDAHKTQIRQAVEVMFPDVKVVDVRTMSVKSKPKRRGLISGRTRSWKKAVVQVRAGDSIPIFQGLQGLEGVVDADPQAQAHQRRSSLRDVRRLRRDHDDASRRSPSSRGCASPAGATRTAARPPAIVAAGPSARIASSTSSGARTGSPAASRRSSTTPTAPRTSRSSTTSTAPRPTSWLPPVCGWGRW